MIDLKERCCEQLFREYHYYRCARRGTVKEGGRLYCKQHAPSFRRARKEKRDDAWNARHAEENRNWKLRELREKIANELLAIYGTSTGFTSTGYTGLDEMMSAYRKLLLSVQPKDTP